MAANYTYDYFISYRRAGDGKVLARNVNDLLEKYGKSVFLDVDDLTMGNYRQELVDAIEQSQYYILILSKETWREQQSIDDYYREIIKIGEEIKSADKDVLLLELDKPNDSIPDILTEKLEKSDFDLPRKQKVKYSHEKGSHNFEYDLCRALRIEYKETAFAKKFSLVIPDNLLPRDKEVEKLFNGIKENRFFNLVGVGGMGKTSLTYLMLERHKKDFNEIAYVVVNNNIKDAIVEQLNTALDLDFKDDMDKYQQLVTYLENSFNATQPNLLVLDINEISDDTKDFIKNINKLCPKNWKVLTLSRENLDTSEIMATEDFNKNQDIEFLKKLFLKRAGNRYEGFEKFSELFAIIFYNPLLAEQLGFYLSKLPEPKSLEAIREILYADTFKNKNMKGYAVLTNDNRSTVINFLTNLASYNSFDHNEQELLRHFVLWQSDFIPYSVIKELLQGVFESDNILADTLSKLAERSILMVKSSEDGSYSYKLHGLLADSLRAQIDIEKEDYSQYLKNIGTIKTYGYYKFIPYVDCIGNSLCEYDIIADHYNLLSSVGTKFYDTRKFDYANKLYQKLIGIVTEKLGRNPNSNEYKYCLAKGYNKLAYLQAFGLQAYDLAKENFEKAIEIGKQLPNDNPDYQDILAWVHNNLAMLQADYLQDNASAKSNYEEAIKIREQISNGNLESKYQNALARAFHTYARFQENHLAEYDPAIQNYQTAIDIRKELKDKPEYQNDLAWSYNNLANLQACHLHDYNSATDNYTMAIEIRRLLADNNPKYKNEWASAYINYATFQQNYLQDFDLAKENYEQARDIREDLIKDNPEYQDDLASAYTILANLLDNHFNDNETAEKYRENAKEIKNHKKALAK